MRNTCCFAGHQPDALPFGTDERDPLCGALKEMLRYEIERLILSGYDTFITGASWGADLIMGETTLELMHKYPVIRLIAALPHMEQASGWPEGYRERYFKLLARVDEDETITYRYTADCLNRRNAYMVEHSSCVLAVYDGRRTGGTAFIIDYAHRLNKRVIAVNPITLARMENFSQESAML